MSGRVFLASWESGSTLGTGHSAQPDALCRAAVVWGIRLDLGLVPATIDDHRAGSIGLAIDGKVGRRGHFPFEISILPRFLGTEQLTSAESWR